MNISTLRIMKLKRAHQRRNLEIVESKNKEKSKEENEEFIEQEKVSNIEAEICINTMLRFLYEQGPKFGSIEEEVKILRKLHKCQNANLLLLIILKNNELGERMYDLKQKAYIVLYNSSTQEDQEMIVELHLEKITNIHQQTISTGFIVIKFQIDTVSYQTQS
ncbi:hypothetical protein C2G38_2224173 [Gigaspora rosea]|uniref:Uncharacterized protein n=1 Tax=Gigaspora rosea TaxID=44941 RepID=A0A397U3L5_9GLOM|nr:hypothetical protein C2G38_2224173 [Gigaspora rosea]